MEILTQIASFVSLGLGIGVLLIACYYVWNYAFKLVLTFFKIHGLFIDFMYGNHNKKRRVFKPTINRKKDEEAEK